MARRDDALGVSGADTIIGSGVNVTGKLSSEGDMVIDGAVKGEIQATGTVTVGVNAEVSAPIKAEGATIAGQVEGSITTLSETSILSTGRVEGDITSSGLSIQSGGIFIGRSIIKANTKSTPISIDRADRVDEE